MRYGLGLAGMTTGKGKQDLKESGIRPVEIFMCSVVRRQGYGEHQLSNCILQFQWVCTCILHQGGLGLQ